LLRRWIDGDFELIVSATLLAELARALAYPKLRKLISPNEADAFVNMLRRAATAAVDPPARRRSPDPGDDYLVALAAANAAYLVTGDNDLLELSDAPVRSPRAFLAMLVDQPAG
jgi:putative PIN family toxin of toxin-antitoxin system